MPLDTVVTHRVGMDPQRRPLSVRVVIESSLSMEEL